MPLVVVGAAGGKRAPQRVEVGDLADATHDPVLAVAAPAPAQAPWRGPERADRHRLRVLARADASCPAGESEGCDLDGTLNCHGYGSSVGVTATFGLVAATRALESAALAPSRPGRPAPL